MAVVTACAYGYDRPPAPAPCPFDGDDDRGRHRPIFHDHRCIVHGVVTPPPPPPPPPLFGLHSGRAGCKADPGLCTEGLGSESSESSGDLDLGGIIVVAAAADDDDIQDCKRRQQEEEEASAVPPARKRAFPPSISVIGAAGKPWQYLRAHRGGGRLVLREVRIPSRKLLHACREDGRLKLHFAHPDPDPDEENNIV